MYSEFVTHNSIRIVFHVSLSGDPIPSLLGFADFGVALNTRAEAALIDWIHVNSCLCTVTIKGSIKVRKN